MLKEYRKLTPTQFKGLIDQLPELRKQQAEFPSLVASVPKERLDAMLEASVNWSALVYECSFAEHVALVVYALNLGGFLKEVLQSEDPQQRVLDDMARPDFGDDVEPLMSPEQLLGLVFTLQRTVLSIMLFQRSMSGLLEEARDGSLDALFNAVRVDRGVLASESIAMRVTRAELTGDRGFFQRLSNALKGPRQKHWAAYSDLRYSLCVLRELGLDRLSDDDLERLMVDTLKVYPSTPTARKNLRRQYQLSRKIKTI